MPVAVITGGTKGFGAAVAAALAERGWELVITARTTRDLRRAAVRLRRAGSPRVDAISGDVVRGEHRGEVRRRVGSRGLDLLLNNASTLGASPLPRARDLRPETFRRTLDVNLVAPLALYQSLREPLRAAGGIVVNVSSDAAVVPYPTWAGYGAAKAGLDHLSAIIAAEERDIRVVSFDPGDMRTDLHQAAFPDEDISDRADPASVAPALLGLLDRRPSSGRYRAADLRDQEAAA